MLSGRITIGSFEIPVYFTLLSIIYSACLFWFYWRVRNRGLNVTQALDIGFIIMAAGFVGGRLLHVFWEYPDVYTADPLRVLYVWNGGFVFYGGAIFAAGLAFLFAQIRKLPAPVWADIISPVLVLGYGLGRVAGFFSGSAYGTPTTLPWGVVYPPGTEAPPYESLHPAALYEAIWSFATVALLLYFEKDKRRPSLLQAHGTIFDLALVLHGVGRIGLEMFRGDYRGPLVLGATISTWIAAAITGWGLLNLVAKIKH